MSSEDDLEMVQADIDLLRSQDADLEQKISDTQDALAQILRVINDLIDDNNLTASDGLNEAVRQAEFLIGQQLTNFPQNDLDEER